MEALSSKTGSSKANQARSNEQQRLELEWQQLEFAIRALEEGEQQFPLTTSLQHHF